MVEVGRRKMLWLEVMSRQGSEGEQNGRVKNVMVEAERVKGMFVVGRGKCYDWEWENVKQILFYIRDSHRDGFLEFFLRFLGIKRKGLTRLHLLYSTLLLSKHYIKYINKLLNHKLSAAILFKKQGDVSRTICPVLLSVLPSRSFSW